MRRDAVATEAGGATRRRSPLGEPTPDGDSKSAAGILSPRQKVGEIRLMNKGAVADGAGVLEA